MEFLSTIKNIEPLTGGYYKIDITIYPVGEPSFDKIVRCLGTSKTGVALLAIGIGGKFKGINSQGVNVKDIKLVDVEIVPLLDDYSRIWKVLDPDKYTADERKSIERCFDVLSRILFSVSEEDKASLCNYATSLDSVDFVDMVTLVTSMGQEWMQEIINN